MKKIFAAASATVFIALTGQLAFARPPVYFKAPINAVGSGCPAGSIIVKDVETDTLKVYFDHYDAARPKSDAASNMWRSSCNFAVPVRVPQGYQASIGTIEWQGYAKGNTELRRKYFFAGRPFVKPQVDHPVGDFIIRDNVSNTWSKCGQDVMLRLNSSITAKSSNSYIAVDTVDLKENGIVFGLQWRKCP